MVGAYFGLSANNRENMHVVSFAYLSLVCILVNPWRYIIRALYVG